MHEVVWLEIFGAYEGEELKVGRKLEKKQKAEYLRRMKIN